MGSKVPLIVCFDQECSLQYIKHFTSQVTYYENQVQVKTEVIKKSPCPNT